MEIPNEYIMLEYKMLKNSLVKYKRGEMWDKVIETEGRIFQLEQIILSFQTQEAKDILTAFRKIDAEMSSQTNISN